MTVIRSQLTNRTRLRTSGTRLASLQFAPQPRFSDLPITLGGLARDLENLSGFFDIQPAKVSCPFGKPA
jgi:hypothetical protein